MGATFHFPDAGGQLGPLLPRLRGLLTTAADEVALRLPLDRLDVVTYASAAVIPELGVNGFAETGHLLLMKVDPANPHLAEHLATAVPALFAHEVHHCIRNRGVGYGTTLGAALVSEGLACHFEAECWGRVPFYARALDRGQIDALRDACAAELRQPWYDHASWFFGNLQRGLPRHAGYTLGHALVGDYLARQGCGASAAVDVPAEDILQTWFPAS